MTKKKADEKKKVSDMVELNDEQASQVKGGGLWQQAIFTNDTITSSKNAATVSTTIKK